MTYLYTANGQTDGYVPHVLAHKTSTQIREWAKEKELRVYEAVPDDPQQMFGWDGNRTLYYVRHHGVFRSVGRVAYYENKHPYYQRGEARKRLLPG